MAFVDVIPGVDPPQLTLQGTNFAPMAGSVELQLRPPLRLLAAVQDLEADPRGHAISLLFNRALSPGEAPEDKAKYEVRSSFGVNGTSAVFHQLGHSIDARDPRRVIVGVASHPSPYVTSTVRVSGLADTGGVAQSPDPQVADLNVRDTTPGGTVEGVVVGAAGQPAAGASVVLRMHETSDTTGQTFLDDFAATTADGAGHFFFEYVQIRQGEVFQVFAADPATGYDGDAFGQLRTAGQQLVVNVVLLGRGDVAGKVLDEAGVPVANAFVTAESVFFKSDENRGSTNSAADGSFSFKSLPVGAVQLWAIDPASRKTAFQTASIPTAGSKVTQNIVIARTPRAALSGDVVHERDGKPAAGVYVVVYGEVVSVPYEPGTDRKYFGYRVTDDSGRFSFTDIQPGADLVQVFDFARSRTPILEQTLQIPADMETVLHLVELEPQFRVGAVEGYARLSANGVTTPLANSLVTVSDAAVGAVTDSTGHYRLDGVPIGSHGLSAYNPATQKFKSGTAVVQEGVVFNLDFVFDTATSSTTVRGLVLDPLDRPVGNAGVAEFDGSGNILRSVIADSTGRFAFTDVTRGGHTYYALGSDDASGAMRDDVGAAFIDYAGTSEGSITIRLAGWGTVQGKVIASHLDEYGNPAESPLGARLVLKSQKLVKIGQFGLIVASGETSNQLSPPADATDSSAADGSYTFANVLGGSFQLTVHHPVFGDQNVSGTITRPGQITTNDFRYSNALSWIDGYLYDEKGNPIGGADVDLWTKGAPPTRDDPRNPPYATVRTLAAATEDGGPGYFRIPALPDRSFTLAFQGVVNGVRRFDQAFVSVGGAPHAIRVTLRTRIVQDVRVKVLIPDANNDLQAVSAASVRLHESDWPNRTFRFDSGPDGVAFFPGISEGRFTLNAQSLAAAGSAGGCVCLDGGIVEATVVLPGSGSVGGVVRFPGTNAPVVSAQVLVLAGGEPVAAIQTSADGSYAVEGLALNRTFTVRVKDSASARFGFAPDFALGANGDQKTRDVTLLALGNVAGTFTDAKGTRPIAGATIELVSDSLLGRTRFYSGTDAAGTFTFSGIPQGTYSLSAQDPLTRLSGRNEGSIDTEGTTVVTNLRAQVSGTVTGRILSASGAPLAIPPILTLSAAGIPSRTVIASDFSFSDLPLVAFTITAEEQASPPRRRSAASGSLTADGEVQTIELRYVAYGDVTVHVTRVNADGSETDAQRGSVAIDNNGVYRGQFPFNQWIPVNAQGRSAFARVGGGTVTAMYWDPVTGRYSSTSADLAVEGSSIEIPVKVLNLANVSGRVMKPAPLSAEPAPGTFVTLGSRTATTGDDGRFLFDGVAYGTYALSVRNDGLPGRAKLSVTLSAANAPLDLGAIVLDGTPPSILQVTPVDGSTGLTRYPTFVVLFSEAIQVSNGSSIQAVAPDSVQYGYVTLSPDRRTMFWSPSALSPGTAYVFRVRPDAFVDDSGWGLASPFLSSFTTRDDTGPAVVQTAPIPNAIQVPVATNVVAVFDSVLRPESIRGGTILLERTLPASGIVSGSVTAGGNSKTAIFTPGAPLAAESRYRATVSGLTDLSGNPMASAYSFSFWTRDDTSPAVSFDPPPVSSFFSGNSYTLAVNWSDPDVRSIDVRVNGASYTTLYPPEGARRATFNYYAGSDASTRIFSAKAADFSGNIGPSATMTVPVTADARPAVTIQVTSPALLLPGQVLSGRVTATDDRGLTLLRLYVSGPFSTYFEWKDVSGQLSATRDFSVTVPITAVSGGPVTLRADASDNNDQRQVSSATDSSASVLRDAAPPVITNVSPPTGASVLPGGTVTVSADVTDDFGLRSVSLDRPGNRLVSQSGSRFTFSFAAPTSGGDFSATLTAVDFAGNAASATVAFHLDADNPPTGSIAISPQGPVMPGASFTVTVAAQDDHGLSNIAIRVTGAASSSGSNGASGVTAAAAFSVKIPVTAEAGALATVYADIKDAQGHTTTVGPSTVTVAADTSSPALFNARPADGENVLSGSAVTIGVDASDNVAVASVDITVDSVTATTTGLFQISWTAKTVSESSPVSILFTARDRAGNSATLGRSIVVNPLSNPTAPAVSIQCPTSGAMFPPGQTVTIAAAASDDQAVQRVEFSRDSEPPFFTATAPPYQASYTIAPTLTDGTTLTLKVKAYDYAGNFSTAQSLVKVVTGDILTANTTILSGDATHDGRTLIVAAGTTAIDGAHSFARLVVLPGAAVTRVSVTTLVESPLDLTVPGGTVYVACGGSITVSGKGYLGGRSGGNNRNEGMTFGNIPGSGVNNGGSHGGSGGVWETGTAAPTFGSITDPRESGGGGGTGYYPGNNGGGVIVLKTGSLIVDGSIISSGAGPDNVGGGGGSVNLDIQTLSGSGVVSAAGSYGYAGSGAGGRVAVAYGDLSGFSRSRVVAGSGDGQTRGSAGTVFLKSSTQVYGELIVDNGVNTAARTALPPAGQTLRFDKVTARNFAKVISQDEIDAVFDVDATSYVATPSRDAPPSVTLTANPSTSVLPGTSLVVTAVMTDDNELEAISLQVTGVVPFAQTRVIRNTKSRTETFTIAIPADAAAGNLAISATVTDAFGHATATSASVAVSPDTVPPALSNARPASSATFSSGQAVTVGVDAADNVRVVSLDIVVDGVTATKTASPYQLTYTTKSVAVATAVPVRFVARDLAGNVATLDWSITVLPVSNPNAPKVTIACPTAGAMFPPGYTFTVSATATDDQAVDRVEFYADAATVPFATDSSSPYSASYAIPPGAADGATVSIRARAWDFAGNFSDALSTITVVVGETISTDTTIGANDLSRDGKTLIFTGGTTTVIGPHSFARLAVLSGSSLTQTQTTSSAFTGLELTVAGRVYVGGGASLDTYGKGYLGAHQVGNSSDSGLTFGNVPGSGRNAAGSHGGVGSGDSGGSYPNDPPAPAYGSPFDPREPGGGGGAAVNGNGTIPGSNGGGVVLVRASSLVLDGFLGAMGNWTYYGEAAAGGSIRLDVGTLSGSGSITASTSTPYYGGGAGGRVAIYGDMSGFDPARINASAGAWGGGAGTVYLRLPGETYGELIVDNGGLSGGGRTPLPAVGTGSVTAVVGATFTDSSKTIPYSVVGYTVEFRRAGTLVGAYRVVSQSGVTLTLDAPIEGTVQAGDAYQGVIKLDKLTLRNTARLYADDILDAASFVGQGPAFVHAPLVRGGQLAIRGAGFEVDEPFSFAGASLTGGAEVRTAESDSTALRVIDLTVSGTLTIDATSRINAQGSGYLGGRRTGNSQDTGMTFGNLPASPAGAGGSHGGLGSLSSSPTFGSLFDPREAGGGAGVQGGFAGGNGGGVVLLKVGSLALDGAIGARGGEFNYYGDGGAAGSIRIEAGSLSGAGTIRAQGGWSYYSGGGGGRVAVFASDFASFDKSRISAPGGSYGAGAGTVYLKSAGQPQGEFVVDNEGLTGGGLTPIPSIGSGTVTAVSGSSLTDSGKTFPSSVVGLQVEVKRDGSLIGIYRVVSQSGGSLVLDAPIEGTVRSGDAYQGILALDAVSVRNHSRVITRDEVRAPLNVDSTSYLLTPSRDAAPTVTVSTNPSATVLGGTNLVVTASGADDNDLAALDLQVTGPVSFSQSKTYRETKSRTETYTIAIPLNATPGSLVIVATARDTYGHPTSATATVAVTADATPPVLSNPRPANGVTVTAGQTVTVGVDASDNVGVASVDITIAGLTTTRTGPPYQTGYAAPPVSSSTPVPVRFTARDKAGNTATLDQSFTVAPLANPNAPVVTLQCPTPGALFPAGYAVPISVGVSDDQAVARVEFSADPDAIPFATITSAPYAATYTVPPALADGTPVTLRIRAYDFANNISEALIPITVVAGDIIPATTTITSDDLSHEGRTVIVSAGTTTISGPHSFARLVVLAGARVTHDPTTSSTIRSLALTVAGGVYVACNGSIDVTGKGYLGAWQSGNPSATGQSYPGVPGSQDKAGGSHGGLGANYYSASPPGSTYGAVFDPEEPGGGGGSSGCCGASGGGVIRLSVGSLVVDGQILADGISNAYASGAGGSIRLDAETLTGSGIVRARGGNGVIGWPPAGAGRIAIYGDMRGFDRSQVQAYGGTDGGVGGAGTIYFKSPSQTYGDLVLHNWNNGGPATPLSSIGSGTVTAVSGATITDSAKVFPYSVVGMFVEIHRGPALIGIYRVVSQNSATLTVDQGVEGTVLAGDAYQGAYRFDSVTLKGTATLASADPIFAGQLQSGGAGQIGTILAPLSGGSIALSGGTIVAGSAGALLFDGVSLQNGAVLTVPPASAAKVYRLWLSVTGAVTIDATSAIDVTGKGYLGALQSGNPLTAGQTYPGVPASQDKAGGSHGGTGAAYYGNSPAGSVFGSFFDPMEAGGGGGSTGCCGSAGGGILRIQAGSLRVDGQVLANGYPSAYASGAGGSIRLDVGTLTGAGTVKANGGNGTIGWPPGGGGRVAVYGDASVFARSRIQARGGTDGGVGGAGTVYFRSPAQSNGDLVLDNGGNAGPATPLPSIGSGTVTAVSGATITDSSKVFPFSVVGLSIEIRRGGALVGTYRVLAQSGGTLTLDSAAEAAVQTGDSYSGVLLVDNLLVGNGAQLSTADTRRIAQVPTGTISFAPASPVLPGKTISVTVAAADNAGLSQIVFSASGAVTASQTQTVSGTSATGNFSVVLPVTAVARSTVSLIADVTDTDANLTRLGPAVVTVAADATPPVLSSPRPADAATFASGASVTVGVDAADDVGVTSVDIIVDGVTTTKTASPYQTSYTAKTVTAAAAVPIRFVARDRAGNTATLDQSITVVPLLSSVTISPSSVLGGVSGTGTVTLAFAAPSPVSVTLSSSDPSAATVPSSVIVSSGSSSAPFTITTKGVAATTTVAINASYGTVTRMASLTVTAASLISLAMTPESVTGGGVTITGIVTLDGLAPPANAVVALSSGDPSAAVVPASVTVLSNTSSKIFTMTSNSIPAPSTFDVTASYIGVSRKATVAVLPLPALASVTLNPPSVLGGASATGTVTLTAPALTNLTVSLSSGNAATATVPLNVTLTSGSISGTFPITTHPVGNTTTFDISATSNGVTRTAPLSVTAAVLTSLTLTPARVVGSGSSTTGKVTLDGAAPANGAVIALVSSDASVTTVPASTTVTGTTVTFPVTSSVVTTASTADISATYNGVTRTATLTVAPPSAPPVGELTEGGASSWGTFASDGKAATVANDSTRFAVGSQSLRFDTASGFDTGVKYPASGSLHWDLTCKTALVFWAYAINANSPSFQGNQPVVVLNSPAGTFRYTPQTEAGMFLDSWHLYQIPIGGSAAWLRTTTGTPTISDVTSLEIHQDTWGAGFTIWYDGVEFSAVDLTALEVSPATIAGGKAVQATVTLSAPAPAAGTLLLLSSDNANAAAVPASILVAAGANAASFPVTTSAVTATTPVTLSAAYLGAARTATLTVVPSTDLASFTLSSGSVGGGGSVTGAVALENPVSAGVLVTFVSSDPAAVPAPADVTFAAGSASASFLVPTNPVSATVNVSLTASANGVSKTATLTVIPVLPPPAGELTEANAPSWVATSFDGLATVTDDALRVKVGARSVRLDTVSGAGAGIGYPSAGSLHWDLTGSKSLVFWTYAIVKGGGVFEGWQPVVFLNTPGGRFTYVPQSEVDMFPNAWHLYQIPLAGSALWTRSTEGAPEMSDVTSIEIRHDMSGGGFTISYDGLGFSGSGLSSLVLTPTAVAGGNPVQATVMLSSPAPPAGALIALSTGDAGSASAPASVFVPAGATAAGFSITTSSVAGATPVTITAEYLGVARTAALTVTAASALDTVSLSPSTVVGGTPVSGTAALTGPAPSTGATVTLSSANAAATVPSSVKIAAGASSAPFTVTTKAAAATATFAISGTYSGATRSAALTVLGAAPASVALNPSSVVGGSSSTGTVTLNGPAPTGGFTVALQSSNTASATVPASVSIAANSTSKTFTVTTLPGSAVTPVTISATAGGATQSAILTVTPAAALASVALNPATVTGGSPSAGTVTMTSAPAADATVNLASSNTSAATVPASVKVLAGTTSATFAVTSKTVAAAAASNISATYAGATRTAPLTVNPSALAGLALSPASVAGVGTSTATVTLTGPAPTGGATVSLSSTDATVATTPASILVPAAARSATFSVTTRAVAAPATADISAAYAGVTKLATLTVTPPSALDSLTLTSATVTGGVPVTGTVTLTYPAVAGGTSVALTSGNTAAATVPTSVTVPAGTLTTTFSVTTKAVAANATFNISATCSGVTKTGSLTVQAATLASLTLTPGRVNGGISSVGAIALTGIAPAAGAVVTLSSTNSSSATPPSSVTVAAGTATAYFLTKTKPLAATAAVNISATYSGVTRTAPLTLVNPDAPVVTLACPTSGALFPAGQTFAAAAVAADAQSVSRVEFWIDGQPSPFATSFVAPYQASYTVPAGFTDGATFTLRARAYDAGGNLGESAAGIIVVAGDVLSADTTISAANAAHDGKTLIVAAGTTTIEGPHAFARLAVLPGAVVRHVPATAGSEPSLDVTVTGALYVACGGAIDASGIGYLGGAAPGNSLAQGLTFGNVAGSEPGAGGSHGGLGGDFSASQLAAQTFGSLFLPRESGGGGGAASGAGGDGGGAVLIAAGSAVVDGAILADGAREVHSGGAGGTVRLDTANLSGSGVIRAAGAASDSSIAASGGGGRIALRYTSSSFDPAHATAPGGNGGKEPGGAGTLLLKPDAESYGELVVDNAGAAGADTPLPSIGTGTVTNVAGSTVADSNRTFPYSVAGLSIEFHRGATVVGTYRVVSSAGGTMTLDRTAAGTVQVGDTYQGVLRLDMLTVKNGARLTTSDRVPVAAAAISLDPNDVVGGLPATGMVTLSAPAPAAGAAVTLSSANTAAATVPASVTVPAGLNAVTFSIATKPVAATVIFEISASFGGVTRVAPLTVEQPALASLALSSTSVVGGVSSTGTLTLTGAAPAAGVVVTLSSANAAVTVPASVTIAAGASTGTFTAATKAVTSSTPVTISATNAGVTQAATLTVLPPAAGSVTVSPADVAGGASPTATVMLTGIAPTGGATVTLSSSNANAATVPASVAVAAGTTSKTFTVTTKTVTAPAPVTISASYGGATQTASLTVEPPSLLSVTVRPASVTGGAASTGTVTLTGAAPTGGATVVLSSSSTAATAPASVTVAAGTSSKTFTVTTTVVASTTPAAISGIYVGATQSATLTVLPAAVSSVAISPASVIGGVSATGTVTLTGAAPAGGLPVTLGSDKTVAATVPASVTVPAGASSATFPITTYAVAAAATASISATGGGAIASGALAVAPPAATSLTLNPATVKGSVSSTGTVTLNGIAPTGGAVVTLSSANAAATVPASVTVLAGSTSATFPITTKMVTATVSFNISASYGGATRTAKLTVNP